MQTQEQMRRTEEKTWTLPRNAVRVSCGAFTSEKNYINLPDHIVPEGVGTA
jgi:hypothetical protein